ncbi:putative transmembrane protein [Toxoplasma gondii GAB2-2007-GAL-DOM2]|uniref:Putative transmembrane protein n=3 Tax=Toxoplasma gondii TaxID=5811 RepID=B9QGY5_TOXGV|nr:putative transmembrane protein [Toxoplasma gondii VEG]KFG40002.1 putative transmembrane protein [Toxoplasma gondii GAB2-2007-GAL-DOM2]KFG44935.1 putative transmembrane protein [Toxoplasma gondii p89]CEL72958.1 TPA: hypothetical protein BN1205_033170 [Toxoplasma gondii VEG]
MAETPLPSSDVTAENAPESVPPGSTADSGVSPDATIQAAASGEPAHNVGSAALIEPGNPSNSSLRWTLRGVLLKVIFCICLAALFGLIFSGIIFIFDLPQKDSNERRHPLSHFALPAAPPQRPESVAFLQPVYAVDDTLPTVTIFLAPNAFDPMETLTDDPADMLKKPSNNDWLVPQAPASTGAIRPAIPRDSGDEQV